MSQEIDLYEERLRPRREILTGHGLGLTALVALVAVVGLSAWAQRGAAQASATAASLQAKVGAQQARLVELSKAVSGRSVSPPLAAELNETRETLEVRRAVVDLLDSGQAGSASGFSEIFAGFSRQALNPNLWLVGLTVTRGGGAVEIRGRTLNASALPAYVQRLGNEAAFRGRRFSGLEMLDRRIEEKAAGATEAPDRTVTPPRFTEFTLYAEGAPEEAQGAATGGRGP